MKAYTLLYDETMPELPGAEKELVLHHIKLACTDFYDASQYAREKLALINVVADTATYAITPSAPTDFAVSRVVSVRWLNGASGFKHLFPKTRSQLDLDVPGWELQTGTPIYYLQDAIDSVTLVRVPSVSVTAGLEVVISKVPLSGGNGIDDDVYDAYVDAIAAGVKARLMRMPKKPWSNATLARQYQAEFNLEAAGAHALAARGYGRAPMRTRPCP